MAQGWRGRLERLESVGWRGDETVVDVGGGNGSLLRALLERHPKLRGVVLDLPETVRAYSGDLPLRDAPEGLLAHLMHDGRF